MDFRRLFNIPVAVPPRQFGPTPASKSTPAAPNGTVGAFVTPESITSFPLATSVIILIWTLANSLNLVAKDHEIYIGIAVSLAVGGFIYYINISDPKTAAKDRRAKIIAAGVALINTAVLLGAAKAVVIRG